MSIIEMDGPIDRTTSRCTTALSPFVNTLQVKEQWMSLRFVWNTNLFKSRVSFCILRTTFQMVSKLVTLFLKLNGLRSDSRSSFCARTFNSPIYKYKFQFIWEGFKRRSHGRARAPTPTPSVHYACDLGLNSQGL